MMLMKPTTSDPNYDPFRHAEHLGVPITWGGTHGHLGLWDGHTIHLAHDLNTRETRSILAHEIVHAEHDDRPTRDHRYSARRERRADRIAAERLIHPKHLAEVLKWTNDPGQAALELNVTGWILAAYARHRPWLFPGN